MSKAEIKKKVKDFTKLIQSKFPIKMVILQKSYPGEENSIDREIEVAVVVDQLEKDFLEVQDELTEFAYKFDPNFDIVLIEKKKEDPTGFFIEVQRTGELIYKTND